MLAIGGTALAFIPDAPRIALDPELALALFVAPAFALRQRGIIGDDAFHRLEEELDWLELGAASREGSV